MKDTVFKKKDTMQSTSNTQPENTVTLAFSMNFLNNLLIK